MRIDPPLGPRASTGFTSGREPSRRPGVSRRKTARPISPGTGVWSARSSGPSTSTSRPTPRIRAAPPRGRESLARRRHPECPDSGRSWSPPPRPGVRTGPRPSAEPVGEPFRVVLGPREHRGPRPQRALPDESHVDRCIPEIVRQPRSDGLPPTMTSLSMRSPLRLRVGGYASGRCRARQLHPRSARRAVPAIPGFRSGRSHHSGLAFGDRSRRPPSVMRNNTPSPTP